MILQLFLFAALAWFLLRLVASPRDPGLWAVVACIALQLLSLPEVITWGFRLVGDLPAASTIKLLVNLGLNVSRYALMLFFLLSTGGSRGRARVEGLVLLAVCAGMTVSVLCLPANLRATAYPLSGSLPHDMNLPGLAPFYLLGGGYAAYACTVTARWALRYAGESSPRGRLGFRVSAIGLAGTTFVAVTRSVVTIIRWTRHPGAGDWLLAKLVDPLVSPAKDLFIIGVCYVGFAARYTALRLWLRRRHAFTALEPLWQRLHAIFPSDQLDPARSSFPLQLGHRYWRRVIEIRDGLVQLGPHLIDAGYDPARPAHEQITAITTAMQRQADGRTPDSQGTVVVAAPTTADVDDDVDQLVRLSRALSSAT
ncbi:hypothetical protein SAMN05421837_102815 [Amycolatopsis pretoriensis]|uniref:DUF6545 domain-containing protein n=1 Tax=Amycolatopsis pretoriensis TaxID=218821 RepID=A0A1H5QF93_9PSEU|nr:MAB_1171c family putative transporter [Amycolatopsis pretoriensis]SEF24679.1 hypothetical protein SAMN05421837_102815 [Amycolatopsis pretoriensis]